MEKKVKLNWLENRGMPGVVTWGVPWEQGQVFPEDGFDLKNTFGDDIAMESGVNALWPDGSCKWTLHSGDFLTQSSQTAPFCLSVSNKKNQPGVKSQEIATQMPDGAIKVDTGRVQAVFSKNASKLIEDVRIDDRACVNYGESIVILETISTSEDMVSRRETTYKSRVEKIEIEHQDGMVCIIKVLGKHVQQKSGEGCMPFILRFAFRKGEADIKLTHTFIIDRQAQGWLLKGMALKFYGALQGEAYNRHIKFAGENGIFHESAQLLSSWRPKIDPQIYKDQCDGRFMTFSVDDANYDNIQKAIEDMTIWDNYRLYQGNDRNFSIKKRTGNEICSFIDALHGEKSTGMGAIFGTEGGFGIGMKDFWQKYPSSLWIDGFTSEETCMSLWIWSYESEGMDFRHYDTKAHASAYYEGFDEVDSTPYGIANTNELTLFGFSGGGISDDVLKTKCMKLQKPALLVCEPTYYRQVRALGEWALADRSTPMKIWLEDEMDNAFEFYRNEVAQRRWYGLFHYGDVMHTYDANRKGWRYDMGGYAWQNTELVPTLWLATAFLRTGREDVFVMMEAMTRHCSEVDVYHIGDYKGIGSRHNVIHWGCACKEPRIAMAGHHRLYYYMTGDYRLKDVFDEVKNGDQATLNIDPLRHFYEKSAMVYPTHARTGPDWATYCSNWMTAWEQGDQVYRDKILIGIADIEQAPMKLISGSDFEYDPQSSHLRYIGENAAGGAHLTICMGGAQVWIELGLQLQAAGWDKMLADYGVFYFASSQDKYTWSKGLIEAKDWPLPYMAASMGMYGARYYQDEVLGNQVWEILTNELIRESQGRGFEPRVTGTHMIGENMVEIPWISTNFASQWCLNVITCLALGAPYLPEKSPVGDGKPL